MKKFSILVVALACCGAAFAQAPQKAEKSTTCAVMGKDHKIDIADATKKGLFADYKGKRYYFCCAGCPKEFKKDPAKYAKNHAGSPIPVKK
jgi:YHS domain-containing protein